MEHAQPLHTDKDKVEMKKREGETDLPVQPSLWQSICAKNKWGKNLQNEAAFPSNTFP